MPLFSRGGSFGEELLLVASGALRAAAGKTSLLSAFKLTPWLGKIFAMQHCRQQHEDSVSDGSTFADW